MQIILRVTIAVSLLQLLVIGAFSQPVTRFHVTSPENPMFICPGQQQTLGIQITAGSQFDSIQWVRNGTYFSSAHTITLNRWQNGDFTARMFIGNDTLRSENKIEVNKFTIETEAGHDNKVCFGEFTTLKAPVLTGATYAWTEVNLDGATVYGTAPTFNTAHDLNIWCRITHNGCSKFAKFRVHKPQTCPTYKIDVPSNPHFICPQPGVDTLRINLGEGLGLDSVQWFMNDSLVLTTSNVNFAANRWMQCQLSAKMWYMRVSMDVPKVNINQFSLASSNGSPKICPNETITLIAPSMPPASYYRWYQGGPIGGSNTVQEGFGDSILVTNYIGNVFCMITHNGCVKWDKFRVLPEKGCSSNTSNKRGLIEADEELESSEVSMLDIDVFPNPASGPFNVIASGMLEGEEAKLNVIDLNGRLIWQQTMMPNTAIERLTVDSVIPSGVYAVTITQGTSYKTSKLVIR